MIFFILFSTLLCVKGDWEIGVATERQVELLSRNGELLSSAAMNMTKTNALAYDPIFGHLYFSDSAYPNASIFQIEVAKDGRTGDFKPLVKKTDDPIEAIAHDPLSSTLFWTTGIAKTIKSLSLNDRFSEPKTLHQFETEVPKGIAVDPCQRHLYWTNCHVSKATIERSSLDGNDRTVLVTGLYLPVSITISQEERKIYWVEVDYGHYFSISRSALDGSQRENLIKAENQQPNSIAVTSSAIYWTDFTNHAVWTANKTNQSTSQAKEIKQYQKATPRGIVTISHFDKLSGVCKNLQDLKSKVPSRVSISISTCLNGFIKKDGGCDCASGYTGLKCEVPICYNYCLNGGRCTTYGSDPKCECPKRYTGKRCELQTCPENLCANNATCVINNGSPICTCSDGYFGDKCHLSIPICTSYCSDSEEKTDLDFRDCLCDSWGLLIKSASLITSSVSSDTDQTWQIVSWSLVGVIVFLVVLMFGMLYKICGLSSRPKLVRRYQVTQNKHAKTSDQCEIAIENCCNMNICEIPCYEPEFRTPKSKGKKDEKKTLLENEVQPDVISQNTELF